jgi:hypothetical protein
LNKIAKGIVFPVKNFDFSAHTLRSRDKDATPAQMAQMAAVVEAFRAPFKAYERTGVHIGKEAKPSLPELAQAYEGTGVHIGKEAKPSLPELARRTQIVYPITTFHRRWKSWTTALSPKSC